jgi:hypothetical protein
MIGKNETSCLLYEFHGKFYGSHFARQIIVKKIFRPIIINPPSSRMPMIIAKVVMYVKIMRKRSIMSGLLHPIPPFKPFEKWGIDLMGPLPVTRRGHQFIMVAIDYFTKFAKVRALKFLVKQKIA